MWFDLRRQSALIDLRFKHVGMGFTGADAVRLGARVSKQSEDNFPLTRPARRSRLGGRSDFRERSAGPGQELHRCGQPNCGD